MERNSKTPRLKHLTEYEAIKVVIATCNYQSIASCKTMVETFYSSRQKQDLSTCERYLVVTLKDDLLKLLLERIEQLANPNK